MKAVASDAFSATASRTKSTAPPPAPAEQNATSGAAATFWLDRLFWCAEYFPAAVYALRKIAARVTFRCSKPVRAGTLANAARILGAQSSADSQRKLARNVVEQFILFCYDIGRAMRMSAEELAARIERIDGHEHYQAARDIQRGAIVITAHMGSFEVGMAALRKQDARIHVVFQRDCFGRFERMRSALRAKLGVIEVPVDDGWTIWMRLREALLNDEVVVLQADRVMPGQKGERVPVLSSDMMLPAGPVKLAVAAGAPIVPVFSIRTPSGKVRLCVEPAIVVEGSSSDCVERAMRQVADVIGKYVRTHGEQWLMLQPVWCDDSAATSAGESAS